MSEILCPDCEHDIDLHDGVCGNGVGCLHSLDGQDCCTCSLNPSDIARTITAELARVKAERDAATEEANRRRAEFETSIDRLIKTETERDALAAKLEAATKLLAVAYGRGIYHDSECAFVYGGCDCGLEKWNDEVEKLIK